MPFPDDQRLRPEESSPDDYPTGPGLPYGATGTDTNGAVYGGPPVAGPVPPGSPPPRFGWQPEVRRAKQATRLRWAIGIVVVFVLLSLLSRACSAIMGADAGAPTPTWTPDPQIETSWVVTPADIDLAAAGMELVLGLDGAFTGAEYVDAGDALVVGYGPAGGTAAARLAGLDRDTGEVLWHRDLGEVRCGDQAFDGAIACVAHENSTWVYHRIDALTGEDLASAVTGLTGADTVHADADALVVVGPADPAPHAPMTAFGPDGDELWTLDLADVDGAGYLFDDLIATDLGNAGVDADATIERPRWRDLDDGLMMLWSTPGVAVIEPGSGEVLAHECKRATPAHDRYFCQDDAGINRRDLGGTVMWSLPDLELVYPADTSDARPVAVSEVFEVIPVDWETGEVTGPAIYRFDPQPGGFTGSILGPSAAGDAQAQYLVQDGEILVKLADDVDEVAWVFEAGEDDSYIDGVFTLDGVSVVDSYTMLGLDAASGEELWRVTNGRGLYASLSGGEIVTIGFDEIAALVLP